MKKEADFPRSRLLKSHLHLPQLTKSNENDGGRVDAGQCRPESIYLHTSAGLPASSVLATLKPPLWQTLANGPLMDTQRQVLFLLAAAAFRTKGHKATPPPPPGRKDAALLTALLQEAKTKVVWNLEMIYSARWKQIARFPSRLDHFKTAANYFIKYLRIFILHIIFVFCYNTLTVNA